MRAAPGRRLADDDGLSEVGLATAGGERRAAEGGGAEGTVVAVVEVEAEGMSGSRASLLHFLLLHSKASTLDAN